MYFTVSDGLSKVRPLLILSTMRRPSGGKKVTPVIHGFVCSDDCLTVNILLDFTSAFSRTVFLISGVLLVVTAIRPKLFKLLCKAVN